MRKLVIWSVALLLAAAPWAQASEADCKALVEKAIKATGGLDTLEKKKGGKLSAKGTIDVNGMIIEFTSDTLMLMPDKMKTTVTVEVMGMKFTVLQVYDGKKFYSNVNGTTMEVDTKEVLDTLREQMHGYYVESLVPLLKEKEFKLSGLGEVKVNDKPAVGVKVERKGYKDTNLYFDKASGLVVKREGVALGPTQQEINFDVTYSDFKDFDGIKVPGKMVMNQDGKKFMEAEVTDRKALEKVDDSEFAKP